MNMRSDLEYESIPNRISYSEIINIIYSQIKKKNAFLYFKQIRYEDN